MPGFSLLHGSCCCSACTGCACRFRWAALRGRALAVVQADERKRVKAEARQEQDAEIARLLSDGYRGCLETTLQLLLCHVLKQVHILMLCLGVDAERMQEACQQNSRSC